MNFDHELDLGFDEFFQHLNCIIIPNDPRITLKIKMLLFRPKI